MGMLTRLAEDTVDKERKKRVNGQTLKSSTMHSATDGNVNSEVISSRTSFFQ